MTYTVRVSSKTPKIKATVASGVIMARTLNELLDVDVSGVKDKYLIMYDASTQKYTTVDPDIVLNNSAETNGGLPQQFINQLDTQLDNKIDIDGGVF